MVRFSMNFLDRQNKCFMLDMRLSKKSKFAFL